MATRAEMVTRPLNVWDKMSLHYRVHERLGEILCYYLIRLRPLETKLALDRLTQIAGRLKTGILQIFPIFGGWDAIVRVWLHPSVHTAFLEELANGVPAHRTFQASRVLKRWYDGATPVENQLVEDLDETTLRNVQSEQDPPLFKKLVEGGLVQARDALRGSAISFFVSVRLESGSNALHDQIINALADYLSENVAIRNASIYDGFGFCSVLLTGQVDLANYFEIAKLPMALNSQFKARDIETDTFLVQGPAIAVGRYPVGEATFQGLRGKNLFVQSFIPELYEGEYAQRHEIEALINREARNKEFTPEGKKLVRNYLAGYLNGNPTEMQTAVFVFSIDLEHRLRTKHQEFACRCTGRPLKDVYAKASIEPSKKHLSLGDLLKVCSTAIRQMGVPEHNDLSADWEDLVNLRNQVAHGDEAFERKWQEHLSVLFKQLPRLSRLMSLIER